ncbi:MAG TPA: EAL domain-containing protein [Catenuloplanes sp.]
MHSSAPSAAGNLLWRGFALAGLLAAGLYLAGFSPLLTFVVIGVASVAGQYLGPRWHRAEPRSAWLLMATASTLFLIGAAIRPVLAGAGGAVVLIIDLFTVPGYLLMLAGFFRLLRSRGGIERHAVLDGLIVCLGAALASTLLLAVPAASIENRPMALMSLLAGIYPLFDICLLLLAINLTFTTAVWLPSLVTLMGTTLLLVSGDLAYAIVGVSGQLYTSPLLDLPFLLAYTLMGVTALHPSVAQLGRATSPAVQAWSWRRMLLIAPAMAVPFALVAGLPRPSTPERAGIAIGGSLMVALLLARAVSAVQAQVAAQLQSRHQAMHDPLTGLPNRRMLSVEIERMLAAVDAVADRQVWVFYLDLDGFKWVNDSWGHDTGDQLIIEVAQRLRLAMPPEATLARVGGDEFVVAHAADKAEAMDIIDRIAASHAAPVAVRDTALVISASIGLAHAAVGDTAPAVTAEALLRDADTAMYRAKSEGPGRWAIFDSSMHERVRERVEIELALRTALSSDQLHVAYQPIVDLPTGRVVGAEALIRWDHPVRGAIPPATFIPIAEDSGLIEQIGSWIRQEAIRQLGSWRAAGTVGGDFWISINVSPRQLRDQHLADAVAGDLTRHGVPAHTVALEITESVMVDGSSMTDQVLFDLRALGVRIVVDDFGTGFSALGYLRRFPVTGVKVDRSFVAGLGTVDEDEEIVRAVVAMSTALGLSVVAEGVETERQCDVLATLGVVLGQGWLWGAAVTAPRFADAWGAGPPPGPSLAAGATSTGRSGDPAGQS